ncbi:amidase [Pseudonocardia thermophila]|uniref:Amidase n=1 Tax=Pseudonocardia thermophila TaxID=1848 RepID=A0A1M7B8I5_PSETH|nr:amidase family protein [Pseudonocardia thermophila]SHL51338.1 amidase [Pseudonocardia thermophila]
MHDAADLTVLDAVDLVARVHEGLSCAVDVVEAHLTRIAVHPGPCPFAAHDRERAMVEAAAVDTRHDRFALPLAGIPVALAETVDVSGWATRHGSAALPDTPARRDDEVVRRLRAAGAVVVGHARSAELGIGADSGAADAVAQRLATVAVGIDNGDGLRVPAARHGLVAVVAGRDTLPPPGGPAAQRLAALGVVARSARDAALLLDVLTGVDEPPPPLPGRVALSLAVPTPFGRSGRVHTDQRAAVVGAAARLRAWPGGAVIALADPPYPRGLTRLWQRRVQADAADLLAAVGEHDPAALGPAAAAAVRRGRRSRADAEDLDRWRDRLLTWLDDGGFDLLLCPAVPGPFAPSDPSSRRTVLTRPWSLAGVPSVVAPVLVEGRPAAVQLVGRPGSERRLLAAAAVLDRRPVPAPGAAPRRVYA